YCKHKTWDGKRLSQVTVVDPDETVRPDPQPSVRCPGNGANAHVAQARGRLEQHKPVSFQTPYARHRRGRPISASAVAARAHPNRAIGVRVQSPHEAGAKTTLATKTG